MNEFKLKAPYEPTGDQPQAIAELVKGFKEGNQCQTLLGVTGSGKTFTMANVIQQLQKPTLVIAHNKTLHRSMYQSLLFCLSHHRKIQLCMQFFPNTPGKSQPHLLAPGTFHA